MKNIKIIKKTDLLVAKTRIGKDKFWQGQAIKIGNEYFTRTEYYQKTKDGTESKHQLSAPYKVKATNVGRANERNEKEQALFELISMTNLQKDKGYHKVGEKEERKYLLPMLANKLVDYDKSDFKTGKFVWTNKIKHIKFPCAGQPKLDGMRAPMETKLGFWSRRGKPFIKETSNHLLFDTKGYTTDGEFMIPHNEKSFQDSMSAVKKYKKGLSEKNSYFVYDIIDTEMTFKERINVIHKLSKNFPKQVYEVETVTINNVDEIKYWHDYFVEKGYEGLMVRNWESKYVLEHRSNDLLKVKLFQDDEFKIIDVIEGDGGSKGTGIFVCKTKKGDVFNCTPEGSKELRESYLKDRKKLIGKLLTVRFMKLSDKGIPTHHNGIAVRDYE